MAQWGRAEGGYQYEAPGGHGGGFDDEYDDESRLRSRDDLPACFEGVFTHRYFNALQSETFTATYGSSGNLVIGSPTGSGKTGCMELAVLRLMSANINERGEWRHRPGRVKVVYIAPIKALVQEKVNEWSARFSSLGIRVSEMTGDTAGEVNFSTLYETDIIVTTPEKFDSTSRRHKDRGGMAFFGDVGLILIDEIHLLGDPRGASLEAIVSRIQILSRHPELKALPIANVRIMAVSATIPNAEDLANWLQVPREGIRLFGEEMRPVKLTTHVYGYPPAKNDFLFERRLNDHVFSVLQKHSGGKPALVFCPSRKGTSDTAKRICDEAAKLNNSLITSREQADRLHRASMKTQNKAMQAAIAKGVAFHHAGLDREDRDLVEDLFSNRLLACLCTTTTLAQGINLPAYLVIIKGTRQYCQQRSQYEEMDASSVLQMSGRAGRPQFDTTGTAVVMTRNDTTQRYRNLVSGMSPLESHLLGTIAEHLNAEIVLKTLSDIATTIVWLRSTYLYVRMKKNPRHYDPRAPPNMSSEQLDDLMKREFIMKNVKELEEFECCKSDGFALEPLEPGVLLAQFYLRFNTLKRISRAPKHASIAQLLFIVADAEEFQDIRLRRGDKKFLNEINTSKTKPLKYFVPDGNGKGKPKARLQEANEKIFVLVSNALEDFPADLPDFSMRQETDRVLDNGARICRFMGKYFAWKQMFAATANSLLLSKCMKAKTWDGSAVECRQLKGVGKKISASLAAEGLGTFDALEMADPRRIERISGKPYPFGNTVRDEILSLPVKPQVRVRRKLANPPRFELDVVLTRPANTHRVGSEWDHSATLLVGTRHDDQILHCEAVSLCGFASPYTRTLIAPAPAPAPGGGGRGAAGSGEVIVAVISEKFVGLDVVQKVDLPVEHVGRGGGGGVGGQAGQPTPASSGPSRQQRPYQGGGVAAGEPPDESGGGVFQAYAQGPSDPHETWGGRGGARQQEIGGQDAAAPPPLLDQPWSPKFQAVKPPPAQPAPARGKERAAAADRERERDRSGEGPNILETMRGKTAGLQRLRAPPAASAARPPRPASNTASATAPPWRGGGGPGGRPFEAMQFMPGLEVRASEAAPAVDGFPQRRPPWPSSGPAGSGEGGGAPPLPVRKRAASAAGGRGADGPAAKEARRPRVVIPSAPAPRAPAAGPGRRELPAATPYVVEEPDDEQPGGGLGDFQAYAEGPSNPHETWGPRKGGAPQQEHRQAGGGWGQQQQQRWQTGAWAPPLAQPQPHPQAPWGQMACPPPQPPSGGWASQGAQHPPPQGPGLRPFGALVAQQQGTGLRSTGAVGAQQPPPQAVGGGMRSTGAVGAQQPPPQAVGGGMRSTGAVGAQQPPPQAVGDGALSTGSVGTQPTVSTDSAQSLFDFLGFDI